MAARRRDPRRRRPPRDSRPRCAPRAPRRRGGLAPPCRRSFAQFVANAYPPRLFVTAHVHLLLVGFMLMIVMGVATWMFPRPAREDTRYRPELAEAVYWVMTVATAVRAVAEIGAPFTPAPAGRVVIALGGLGQLAGAVLFVANMWWRVRMPAVAPPPR